MTKQQTVSDFLATIDKSDRTCRNHRQKLEETYSLELVERRGSQYFVIEPYTALWIASLRNDSLPAVGDDLEAWCNDYLATESEPEPEPIQGEIEIYDSQAIQSLPQPEFSSSIDLGGFSSNTFEAQSYSDPMAVVDRVRRGHDQIIAAMRQNVADGQQILNATTHAVLEMDEESRRIADAAEQYRIEKAVQSALVNQQQQALQQKVQQQQSLGKPATGSQQPQS